MKKSAAGFTLVEIIIVIALIGILAAIVLLNFNDARDVSRTAKAKEELKNVTYALEQYRDRVGALPVSGSGSHWEANVIPEIERQTAARLPARDPWGSYYAYTNNFLMNSANLPTLVCSLGKNTTLDTSASDAVAKVDDVCIFLSEADDS